MNKKLLEIFYKYVNDNTQASRETLSKIADSRGMSFNSLVHAFAIEAPIYDIIFKMPKLRQHETAVTQTPTASQHAMIDALSEEINKFQYAALCHQLYKSKLEFNDEDGVANSNIGNEDYKYYYTVQSSLYRGIFWETLAAYDDAMIELEKKLLQVVDSLPNGNNYIEGTIEILQSQA